MPGRGPGIFDNRPVYIYIRCSALERGVHAELCLEQLRDRTTGLRLLGALEHLRGIGARRRDHRVEVARGDGHLLSDFLERDSGGCLNLAGRQARLLQLERERHRETAGVQGDVQKGTRRTRP